MRRVIRLLATIFVLVAAAPAARSSDQPNIVLIMVDDAGYNEFGFSNDLVGNSYVSDTPNINALASTGVVFSNGYVGAPLCSPSRAALMTGQYTQRFGYENNIGDDIDSDVGLQAGQQTMAHHLKNVGYTTGLVGKWHLGFADGVNRPQDMGFDEFYGILGGTRDYFRSFAAPSHRMRRGDEDIEAVWGTEGDPSLYDPARGRYATDAFGEESADFINRHAGSDQPFFLYASITAPHIPIQVKQSDYDHFPEITESVQARQIAALNYSSDRAVGMIMDALQANGVDDNTIVVFLNDNGAPYGTVQNNNPFLGKKGSMFEGGIRVPFFARIPGVEPGVYDHPITARDLLPTLLKQAGGDPDSLDLDGVDLTPYINGDVEDAPHRVLFWRGIDGRFAVRKGDWKLTRYAEFSFARLHNLSGNGREDVVYNWNGQNADITADLDRELTRWEATLERPAWTNGGERVFHVEDHFIHQNQVAAESVWSDADLWNEHGSREVTTLDREDAYANLVLEFTTRDDADYTATNDMRRATLSDFMLNEIRFTGEFQGAADRQALINDSSPRAIVYVNNLAGQSPKLRLDAVGSGDNQFTFRLDQEMYLLHSMDIIGDGDQRFVLAGDIRDFDEPVDLRKSGSSILTVEGLLQVSGNIELNGGVVSVDHADARVINAASITIAPGAAFALKNGLIDTPLVRGAAEGFEMSGGSLRTSRFEGDLTVGGGEIAPQSPAGLLTVTGGFSLGPDASVELEVGGPTPGEDHSQVIVEQNASLSGQVTLSWADGFELPAGRFLELLLADSILAEGVSLDQVSQQNGLGFAIGSGAHDALVLVHASALPGDFNKDGVVDAADYTVWRDNQGTTGEPGLSGDGDDGSGTGAYDGVVDNNDYLLWRQWFGVRLLPQTLQIASIPEPASIVLAALGVAVAATSRRRCSPVLTPHAHR